MIAPMLLFLHLKEQITNYKQILGNGCMSGNDSCREWAFMRKGGLSKS